MSQRFVYFDLGNVLVHFDHQIAVDQLSDIAGRPKQLVRSVVFESDLQNRYETGLVNGAEFAQQINLGLDTSLPKERILEAISAIFTPNDAILSPLQRLREAGVSMGVLSNTCEAHWRWILDQHWPMLDSWFDVLVLSYEVGCMKPDGKIYQICEEQAGCEPSCIFFTDDRIENVDAARQRGWETHHFHSASAMLVQLENWLASAKK